MFWKGSASENVVAVSVKAINAPFIYNSSKRIFDINYLIIGTICRVYCDPYGLQYTGRISNNIYLWKLFRMQCSSKHKVLNVYILDLPNETTQNIKWRTNQPTRLTQNEKSCWKSNKSLLAQTIHRTHLAWFPSRTNILKTPRDAHKKLESCYFFFDHYRVPLHRLSCSIPFIAIASKWNILINIFCWLLLSTIRFELCAANRCPFPCFHMR